MDQGRPAAVHRNELSLFHFFDKFPEVSSQYNHIRNDTTRDPLAFARQLFPWAGSVEYVQGNIPPECALHMPEILSK